MYGTSIEPLTLDDVDGLIRVVLPLVYCGCFRMSVAVMVVVVVVVGVVDVDVV